MTRPTLPPPRSWRPLLLGAAALLAAHAAAAQNVSLNGQIGANKALLVIDGEPRTLAVGESSRGVTLRALREGSAEIEIAGARRTLALSAGPVRASAVASEPAAGREIIIPAGRNGHFRTIGQINGRSVEFMVDTGASVISMGQAEADMLGVDYRNGTPGLARTANGVVPTRSVVLSRVRIGDVEIANVEASVSPGTLGIVLLGNSFLQRFQMRRDNDVLRLEKRN